MIDLGSGLRSLLSHPLTRGMDIDDPAVTELRKQIIQQNSFLHHVYLEWYNLVVEALSADISGPILELGSGGGYLNEIIPTLITSDISPGTETQLVLDGQHLPIGAKQLRAIVLINVLHHFANPIGFLSEANRCVKPGGKILLVEPWVTAWSRIIYKHLHHEPFVPESRSWSHPADGPLSGANGAMPWIIFMRDRSEFERLYPEWDVRNVVTMMPFLYLVSGGVSMRRLMPVWSFGVWKTLEELLTFSMNKLAMFAFIELQKRTESVN
jgi:SAM-dependent methyltransferase